MGYFLKALQIMGIVSAWSAKALQDGKISINEATELAEGIAEVLGIKVEIEL